MYISRIEFVMFFFFLVGCMGIAPTAPYGQNPYGQQNPYGPQNPYGQNPNGPQNFPSQTTRPYFPSEKDSEDSGRSRSRSGNACEDRDKDHECYDQCSDMYRGNDIRKCKKKEPSEIEDMFEVYEILKEAEFADFEESHLEDFKAFLDISINAFEYLVRRYDDRSAIQELWVWIVEDEEVTKLIQRKDYEYRTLTRLLGELKSWDNNEIYRPFTKSVRGRESLMEAAIGNENALSWFSEYLTEEGGCPDEVNVTCFKHFCKIGKDMGRTGPEDWADHSGVLQDLIDEVIERGINHSGGEGTSAAPYYWGANTNNQDEYGDVDDLDDFVEDLCEITAGDSTDLTR